MQGPCWFDIYGDAVFLFRDGVNVLGHCFPNALAEPSGWESCLRGVKALTQWEDLEVCVLRGRVVKELVFVNPCNTFVQTPEVWLVISRGIKMHVGCHPLLLKCDYHHCSPTLTNKFASTQLLFQGMINCLWLGEESWAEFPIWFLPSSWDIAED